MFRTAALSLCLVVALAATGAANKEENRLENSGVVLEDVVGVPDNIPQELLDKAECVIVIPSMLKVAVGPEGRDVAAATDATMRAEILSYSRTRGLFAGVSLDGASLRPDNLLVPAADSKGATH